MWDEDKKCEHQWQTETYQIGNKAGNKDKSVSWFAERNNMLAQCEASKIRQADFCVKCNAWRGSLGLEPTFELYLKHLLWIFDKIKRILKPTGTCWVNLGDSYFGGGRGSDAKLRGADKGKPTFESMNIAKPNWNNMNYLAKSLCLIPERFAIGMVETDSDDEYELRKDLTEEERKYVLTELTKRGII